MSPSDMTCNACGSSFDATSFCPACGSPTPLASDDERILWEMGQWDTDTEEHATVSLADRADQASVAASPRAKAERNAADKPKPFSPVPMPKRSGGTPSPAPKPRPAPKPSSKASPRTGSGVGPAARPRPHLVPVTDGAAALAPQEIHEEVVEERPEPPRREPAAQETVKRASDLVQDETATRSAQPTAEPAPKRARVKRRRAKAERAPKLSRRERRERRMFARLEQIDGEQMTHILEGTVGFNPVSLIVTNYRVAVVPHSKRLPVRWIPLEEVTTIACRRGSSVVTIDASVEVLRFGTRRTNKLHEAVATLREDVKEARSGRSGTRHNAQLVQLWCDRTAEIWDSPWGRLRVWAAHHPQVKVAWALPFVPAVYIAATRVL